MPAFNLDNYETVQSRIDAFWEQYPEGRIHTHVLHRDDKTFIVQALIFRDEMSDTEPFASGMAEEIVGSNPVNKTSALENCETSAIGRALRIGGIGREASREEMEKVERRNKQTKTAKQPALQLQDLIETALKATTIDELRNIWTLAEQQQLLDALATADVTVRDYLQQLATDMAGETDAN